MNLPPSSWLNRCLTTFLFEQAATFAFAQTTAPDTTFRSTFYEQKRTLFENLPNTKNEIIFLGNSISDFGERAEPFEDHHVKNRVISGDLSFGVLARLGEVTASKPAKVFLLIGILTWPTARANSTLGTPTTGFTLSARATSGG